MRHAIHATLSLLGAAAVLYGCATPAPKAVDPMVPAATAAVNRVTGYLSAEAVPDSTKLSPPPPAAGSTAQALDDEISRKYLALRGTPRFVLAAQDAVLTFPEAAETFTCAVNAPITRAETPTVYTLLERSLIDSGRATRGAKNLYKRVRPFSVNGQPTCTPASDEALRQNHSYPSGHSSAGWAWALILAEVSPAQSTEILARGRAFAQSRLVCNVHWYSDTMEGITMASAAVARMHAEPAFISDVAKARKELDEVRAKGTPVRRDCKAEAAALAQPIQ